MKKSQYTTESRKELRKRKNVLVFLTLCLFISTTISLSIVKVNVYDTANQEFKNELELLLLEKIQKNNLEHTNDVKSGINNLNFHYLIISKNENERLLKHLKAQNKTHSENLKDVNSVIFSFISENMINDQLIYRNLVTKEYLWNEEKKIFTKKEEYSFIGEILMADTKEQVKLNNLVKDEASLRAINRVMQEKILEQHPTPNDIIEDVLTRSELVYESEVEIMPASLQIKIDKDLFGLDSVIIEYNEIIPYINTKFIDPAVLEAQQSEILEEKKVIALTFDDGPNTTSTVRLLELLANQNVEATFFLLGQMVSMHPYIAEEIRNRGHEIANHSYSHPDLTKLSREDIREEVIKTDKAIFKATGILPKNFRAPYGAVNQEVIMAIGMPIIHWDVDSMDWKLKDSNSIVNRVINDVQSGSIILLHDIHESSVDAVHKIIRNLSDQGYKFVTVSELFSHAQKPYYQYFRVENHSNNE